MPFVVGVRWSFRGNGARAFGARESADSSAIGATEDAASGRAAWPDGTTAFRQSLLEADDGRRARTLSFVNDAVALCADAAARWHDSWLTSLGVRTERDGDAWRAVDPPPFIYFGAITLGPETPPEAVGDAPGSVCDAWQTLDLAPHGFRVWRKEPWFQRPAGEVKVVVPPELEVVRVTTPAEVEEFEAVSVRGFDNEEATIEPGMFHPTTILADPAMKMFIGRVDGKPVAAAMGYETEVAVGVFGVTTVASARRRGYGAAVTRAAMLTETGLPSILAPSEMGENVYRRLGFEPVGALSIWTKRV